MRRKPDFQNLRVVPDIVEAERLLTARETARLLGVTVYTLRGWRGRNPRAGREGPPFIRIGGRVGRVRYSRKALQKYLSERTVRQHLQQTQEQRNGTFPSRDSQPRN
jgi:hypothetical protein